MNDYNRFVSTKDNIIFTNARNPYSRKTTQRLYFRSFTHEGYITSGRISDTIIYSQRTGRLTRTEAIAKRRKARVVR